MRPRFHTLVEVLAPHLPKGPAEVCPQTESAPEPEIPSKWAQSALGFTPDPKQQQVLDHDAHRLILCCSRQWGKTTIIAIKALHTAIHQPNSEIVVISRSLKQAGILIGRLCQSAATLGFPRKRVLGYEHSLQLPNGSRIFAIANSEKSSRGYTASIVIVDEAALVADEVIGTATPTLTRTNGKLWLLSTPNGQTGLFYNVWHDKELTNWCRVKATIEDCPFADKAFVDEQRRLFPHNFRQEFHCEFTPAKGRLLSRERIEAMIDPTIKHTPFPSLSDDLWQNPGRK